MESFQKRDRDRKKLLKRNAKENRRKERSDQRRDGPIAGPQLPPHVDGPLASSEPPATEQPNGVAP